MKKVTKTYIIKTWDELTEAEKEKEKQRHAEDISIAYDNELWQLTEEDLKAIEASLKIISFNKSILDSLEIKDTSQGWYIKGFKGLKAITPSFDGSDIDTEVGGLGCDGNSHLKNIEDLGEENGLYVYFDPYKVDIEKYGSGYITFDELQEIAEEKGNDDLLKDFEDFKKEYNFLMQEVSKILQYYFNNRFEPNDEYINNYFDGVEFEFLEN